MDNPHLGGVLRGQIDAAPLVGPSSSGLCRDLYSVSGVDVIWKARMMCLQSFSRLVPMCRVVGIAEEVDVAGRYETLFFRE